MLEYIKNMFGKGSAPPPSESKQGALVPTYISGRELYPTYNFDKQIENYISWIYICANMISTNCASNSLRWYVSVPSKQSKIIGDTRPVSKKVNAYLRSKSTLTSYTKKAYEIQEVVDGPYIDLFKSVNGYLNEYSFIELLQQWLEVTGNCYVYVEKDGSGIPTQMFIFPTQNMTIIPDKNSNTLVKEYVYKNGLEKYTFTPEEMIHFRYHSVKDLYYGLSPLMAAIAPHELYKSMQAFEKEILDNSGLHNLDVKIIGADQKKIDEYRSKYNEKHTGVGKRAQNFWHNEQVEIRPLGITPRDMNFLQGRKLMVDEICSCYGVPIAMIRADTVNRATVEASQYQFAVNTIYPRLVKLEQQINQSIVPMFDEPNLFCAFDSCIPEDEQFELNRANTLYSSGIITRDEAREMMKLDPIDGENVFYQDSGAIPIVNPENVARGIAEKLNKNIGEEND